jgi:1,4-dihydroxy-2-naphthoate octaprenyltransferase
MTLGRLRAFANYLWQLRPYSYSDLLLLLLAVQATGREMLAISLLWFGFLIHLEWRHNDSGRLKWPWWAWVLVWSVAFALMLKLTVLVFFVCAAVYALKKKVRAIGALSFVVNGCVKGALLLPLTSISWRLVLLVTAVMALRNLAGDFRDAGKDAKMGVTSLPVLLGYRRNTGVVYPLCLAATSCLWTVLGNRPWWELGGALAVQLATYRRTPR